MIPTNAIAIAAYLVTAWLIMRWFPAYRVFFGLFTFMNSWALVSCFYNDLGIYNMELFRYTSTTFATSRLALFCIVFNLGFAIMAGLVGNRPLRRRQYQVKPAGLALGNLRLAGYVVIVATAAYVVYTLIQGGIPLLSGLDRHAYMSQAGRVERTLLVYGPLITFLCGYFKPEGKRYSVSTIVMLAFLIYVILIGNKFSLIILLLVSYYGPVFARRISASDGRKLINLKRLLMYASLVVVVLGYVGFSYVRTFGDRRLAFEYMYNRIFAFQGQMWWAVDNDIQSDGRYDRYHWKTEYDRIVAPRNPEIGEVGLRYLMVKVLGPEKAYPIIDRGYLYTGTYPAILVATFPYWLALVMQLLAGIFFFLILYYLHYCVVYRHLVRSAIVILILVPFTVTLFIGGFATVLTLGLIVKLGLLALLEIGLGPISSDKRSVSVADEVH